jgi:hypothetical protein
MSPVPHKVLLFLMSQVLRFYTALLNSALQFTVPDCQHRYWVLIVSYQVRTSLLSKSSSKIKISTKCEDQKFPDVTHKGLFVNCTVFCQ